MKFKVILILICCCFGFNIISVNAAKPAPDDVEANCKYILGDPDDPDDFAWYLNKTFSFVKFVAPILVIVLTVFDYIKAIISSDGDLVKKTNTKTIKRIIFAMLLFVLPIIISSLLTLIGLQGTCSV